MSVAARAPRPAVLVLIAFTGCTAAGGSFALALTCDHVAEPGLQAALLVWMALPYVLAGVVAWWRRPESRFGPLMVGAGFVGLLATLAWSDAALPFTIGQTVDLVPAVLFLHVFLAFPTGRLERRLEQVTVALGYVVALGLELVGMLLGGFGPDNLLELLSEPDTAQTVLDIQLVSISALVLIGVGVLVARRRGRGRPLRRSSELLVDCFGLALVMVAILFLAGASGAPAFETIRRVTFVVLGLAPMAFLIGLLNARLARGALGDLLVELRSELGPAELRDALSRALGDESLRLAFWLPEFESWSDLEGRSVELPERDPGSATTLIDRDGEQLAALLHNPSLYEEPELLDAVSAGAGIALENSRLQVELRARLEELKSSRGRVLEAGRQERQRLERNLHDGAQQRLIALSLELGMLGEQLEADPAARARLELARGEIAMSLEELRDVARGLHPAVVSGHGLSVGLESLAAGAAGPVQLSVALAERLQEPIEVAAYYVVAESLANVGKHAEAASVTVDVARANGSLVVEIVDDGVGGADSESGTGLRGLADRVEALGGRLQVWTPRGEGTRVRAEIPCA